MGRHRRNEPIRSWEAGDAVQGFALVTRKDVREDRNGKSYVDLELADQSGSIAGKVWADSRAAQSDFAAPDFVAFRGMVKLYRDQLQLTVDDCRRATDEDRAHGFDEALLIPSAREDLDQLYARLERTLDGIERPVLRRLAAETLAVHGEALRVHPAAKSMHHAYRGGLLEHVVSMAELAVAVAGHYRDLDRDLLLIGVLFHDLGKLQELGAMPANDYTLPGRLVGHVVLGRDLLRERAAAIPDFPPELRLLLEHLVLSHQGRMEYASPVEPMTAEALALHFIDDLDSKMNQIVRLRESQRGMVWHRGLGRHLYLGDAPAEPAAAVDPDGPADELPPRGLAGEVEPARLHPAPADGPAGDPAGDPAEPATRPTLFDP